MDIKPTQSQPVQGETLHGAFAEKVRNVLSALAEQGALPTDLETGNVTVEPPRDPSHGDLATNAAMVLAKQAKSNPRALAELICAELLRDDAIVTAEIAGPGFINMRLSDQSWLDELAIIAELGADYGRSTMGGNSRVNVEFVSANPTGPMHMGHCRGAVVGDALASLLEFSGHHVTREYYVNDAGGQVDVLARSAHLRYLQALAKDTGGEDIGAIPEGLYPGEYLVPFGEAMAQEFGDKYAEAPEAEWLPLFREKSVAAMMELIKTDLGLLGIHHDIFASEAELQAGGKPDAAEQWLRANDLVYDGVLEAPKGKLPDDWEAVELPLFRSTQFGDDQDRPIKKSDGSWTYFGADLAYHMQKAENADALIDVWGADHAGTVKRIKAAVAALSQRGAADKGGPDKGGPDKVAPDKGDSDKEGGSNGDQGADHDKGTGSGGGEHRAIPFDVKLVQMVQLLRDGEPVKMSKRSGNFVTLAEVVQEVGKDLTRFTMLTRKPEAQMEFDFAKVVEASKDNPVFYVQYAHARICSTLRKGGAEGCVSNGSHLDQLGDEELGLVKQAAQFPRIIEAAAKAREPHRIAFFLYDLASAFHSYWNLGNDDVQKRFILAQHQELTGARLFLASQIGQVVRNGLALLGVQAVEEM